MSAATKEDVAARAIDNGDRATSPSVGNVGRESPVNATNDGNALFACVARAIVTNHGRLRTTSATAYFDDSYFCAHAVDPRKGISSRRYRREAERAMRHAAKKVRK